MNSASSPGTFGKLWSTQPLITVAKAARKADALAGLERWKARYPEAAARLHVDDVLVDSMRGRSTNWTRIRINLRNVPEGERSLFLRRAGWVKARSTERSPGSASQRNVPLAEHIRRVLDERPGHRAPATRFLRELEDHLSEEEAERVFETVINWGRHAEIFAYDYDTEVLSLENF